MSIPSSSASVAATPSSSPSISRRSISRRCAGVYPARYGASRAAVAVSTRSEVKRWISSAALRLLAKQIVRSPRETRPAIRMRGLGEGARPDPELRVEECRVPERDVPLGARAERVGLDDRDRLTGKGERELTGVCDRGRGEQKPGVGTVEASESTQPPDHVADVGAKDAAVDVRLVDHDVAQVVEHIAPAVVVGEDPDVEHVRVRQDQVRGLPDLPAPLRFGVAVVDRGPHPGQAERRDAPRLILGERLRRVEVDGAGGGLAHDCVEHRQVEGEGLPRGGSRRDEDALAPGRRLPGLALVRRRARRSRRRSRAAATRVSRPAGSGSDPRCRATARSSGTRARHRRADRPRDVSRRRGTARTTARSGSCSEARRASPSPRRSRTGSRSESRECRSGTAFPGWRRCRS